MSFLNRLFGRRPAEVQASLDALEALRPLFSKVLSASLVLDRVKRATSAKASEAAVTESINAGSSPREVVLYAIAQTARQLLSTGQYHVYRGVLGMEGNDIRSIYHISLSQLVKSGFASEAEAEEHQKELKEIIAGVG